MSHTNDQQLRWLINTWTKLHEPNEQNEIIFLITEGSQKTIIEDIVSPTSKSHHLTIISTEQELRKQLEKLKNRILTEGEAVNQVT